MLQLQHKITKKNGIKLSLLKRIKNFFIKSNKITKLAFISFFALGLLTTNAFAQYTITTPNGTAPEFSCNALYAVPDPGPGGGGTGDYAYLHKIVDENGNFLSPAVRVYTSGQSWPSTSGTTIALGKPGGRNSSNPLEMYSWGYADTSKDTGVATSGSLSARLFTPTGISSEARPGGEVDPNTGYIVYSGPLNSDLDAFRLSWVNPTTGAVVKQLQGLTPAAGVTGLANGASIQSDMTFDAEGYVYVIAGSSSAGGTILRINPDTGQYTGVITNSAIQATTIWGMAFFKGELYYSRSDTIYKLNLVTGATSTVGVYRQQGGTAFANVLDLASCQTAPVLRGTVYYDASGMGSVSNTTAKLANATVELYRSVGGNAVYLNSVKTDSSGTYTFILDSTTDAYFVRVVRPQQGGVNLGMSYSSGSNTQNKVYNYCAGSENTTSKPCIGAKIGGVDDAAKSSGFSGVIANFANFYSKVQMTTDAEVAVADFAFTDRVSSANTLIPATPAKHIITVDPTLYLGSSVSNVKNAVGDGVYVKQQGTYNLVNSNTTLVAGNSYEFQVKTSGNASSSGYLNSWISWGSGGNQSSFVTLMTTGKNETSAGYIDFNFTIPASTTASIGVHDSYMRFRFSTTQTLNATGGPSSVNSASQPWVIDGEVEDYKIIIRKVGPANFTLSNITANPTNVTVGENSTITVFVADSTGYPLDNQNITLFIKSGNGSISNITAVGGDSGNYTAILTSNITGSVAVGYEVQGVGNSTQNATVTFNTDSVDVDHANTTIIANPTATVVNNTTTVTVTL
ncbi:MAG: hypothetical protein ACK5LP_10820, partial [Campylobacteraceae bacterium]